MPFPWNALLGYCTVYYLVRLEISRIYKNVNKYLEYPKQRKHISRDHVCLFGKINSVLINSITKIIGVKTSSSIRICCPFSPCCIIFEFVNVVSISTIHKATQAGWFACFPKTLINPLAGWRE